MGWEAGESWVKRASGEQVDRLFPHYSTQVVDFPRMCGVSLFYEGPKTSEIRQGNDWQRNGAEVGSGKWRRTEPHVLQRNATGHISMRVELKRHECAPRNAALPRVWRNPQSLGSTEGGVKRCGKNYGFFRGFPRFYAQIRAVITRFYAFLRVRAFFRGVLAHGHHGGKPRGNA